MPQTSIQAKDETHWAWEQTGKFEPTNSKSNPPIPKRKDDATTREPIFEQASRRAQIGAGPSESVHGSNDPIHVPGYAAKPDASTQQNSKSTTTSTANVVSEPSHTELVVGKSSKIKRTRRGNGNGQQKVIIAQSRF